MTLLAARGGVWVVLLLAVTGLLAGCGGGDDATRRRVDELSRRIDTLEAAAAAQKRMNDALLTALKDQGVVLHAEPPADAGEALAREVEALVAAIENAQSAADAKNVSAFTRAQEVANAHVAALKRAGGPAMDALVQAVHTAKSPETAARLVSVLAEVGGNAATKTLQTLAYDVTRPVAVRSSAAQSIITLEKAQAIPILGALINGPDPFPDAYILVHALGETHDAAVVPLLIQTLEASRDRSVRCHAATALGGYPSAQSAATLAAAAKSDEYPAVRVNALRALLRASQDAAAVSQVAEDVLAHDAAKDVKAVAQEVVNQARLGRVGPADAQH